MGYSISWLAVKNVEPPEVHRRFDVAGTSQYGDYADHPIVGRLLPSGWYLLVAQRCDHPITLESLLARNSADCEILACSIEEHVMYVSAAYWQNGCKVWSILHRGGDYGTMDLLVDGELPGVFEEIRAKCFAEQIADSEGGVDYIFEIPLEMVRFYTGFKHDEETPGVEDGSFQILRFNKPKQSACTENPWWRFWS